MGGVTPLQKREWGTGPTSQAEAALGWSVPSGWWGALQGTVLQTLGLSLRPPIPTRPQGPILPLPPPTEDEAGGGRPTSLTVTVASHPSRRGSLRGKRSPTRAGCRPPVSSCASCLHCGSRPWHWPSCSPSTDGRRTAVRTGARSCRVEGPAEGWAVGWRGGQPVCHVLDDTCPDPEACGCCFPTPSQSPALLRVQPGSITTVHTGLQTGESLVSGSWGPAPWVARRCARRVHPWAEGWVGLRSRGPGAPRAGGA